MFVLIRRGLAPHKFLNLGPQLPCYATGDIIKVPWCIYIGKHLTLVEHISHISKKIAKNISILSRIRHCLPKCTLQGLYYSLIFLYLSYCSISWGCYYTSRLNSLKPFKSAHCALFLCFHGLPALSQYSKHIIYCTMKILLNINLVYSCIVTTINYYHHISITTFVKVYPSTNTIQGIPATIGVILLVQKPCSFQ